MNYQWKLMICIFGISKIFTSSLNPKCHHISNECQLENISLERNGNIDVGTIHDNTNIYTLVIESSKIDFMSGIFIRKFPNLEKLDFRQVDLRKIDNNFFESEYERIKHLIVAGHNLEIVEENSLDKLKNLVRLELLNGKIENLQVHVFRYNTKLEVINIINHKLRVLDVNIFRPHPNLDTVNLGNNQLSHFDPNLIANNQNIKRIFFYGNNYDTLPANSFSNSLKLVEINFGDNHLENLDKNLFKHNRNLQKVQFYGNNIKEIDENLFSNLRNLEELNLGENSIKNLHPSLFRNNGKLRVLHFFGNQFENLYSEVFEKIPNLEEVNFGDNLLTYIHPDVFKSNRKLKKFMFYGNQIKRIEPQVFDRLSNLETVDFGNNRLEYLGDLFFQDHRQLKVINLYGNSITGLVNFFDSIPNLNQVDLTSNVCIDKKFSTADGSMSKMKDELKNCFENCEENVKCSSFIIDPRTSIGQETCGQQIIGQSLVHKGQKFERGKWPWMAAFMHKNSFICGGNLISKRAVITAAHCIQDKGDPSPKQPGDSIFLVGKYDLRNNENGQQSLNVERFIVHPDWSAVRLTKYEGDLALSLLQNLVEFTDYVRPICLNSGTNSVELFVKTEGFVTGWGSTETSNEQADEAREVEIPIVKNDDCLTSNAAFFYIFSSKSSFCAGSKDGKGPCKGDSGSGLYLKKNDTWILLGITSASLFSQNTCDLDNYVIFTDVGKHERWILDNVV